MTRRDRRRRLVVVCSTIAGVVLLSHYLYSMTLFDTSFRTGWILFLLFIALSSYGIRKKISFLPLGNMSVWLRVHICLGVLTTIFFLCHVRFSIPNGILETALALVYLAVVLSGLFGLLVYNIFPKRLTSRGEDVVFSRIPMLRRKIADQADRLVLGVVGEPGSEALSGYYLKRLKPYFSKGKYFYLHLTESRREYFGFCEELKSLRRNLREGDRQVLDLLLELVEQKDHLDYCYAHQKVLRAWPFIHIPCTYLLLILSLLHAFLAHTFSGGAL